MHVHMAYSISHTAPKYYQIYFFNPKLSNHSAPWSVNVQKYDMDMNSLTLVSAFSAHATNATEVN